MARKKKKKRGHYCWGCDSYKSNECFSGKGHRNHLCKKCKTQGVKSRPKKEVFIQAEKREPNPFMKYIKVKYIISIDFDSYIVFGSGGALYVAYHNDYMGVYYVYEYKKNEEYPLVETSAFNDGKAYEAISYKSSQKSFDGFEVEVESVSEIEGIVEFEKRYLDRLSQWFDKESDVNIDEWNSEVFEHDETDREDLYLTYFRALYTEVTEREKHILRSLLKLKKKIKEREILDDTETDEVSERLYDEDFITDDQCRAEIIDYMGRAQYGKALYLYRDYKKSEEIIK